MTTATALSLLSAFLTLLRYFVTFAEQQKWIAEGTAKAVLQSVKDSDDAIAKARSARKAVRDAIARDPDSIMRDDKYTRSGD